MSQAPLVLVDGSSYLYRAAQSLSHLVTTTGKPTGAIKGMLNIVQKILSAAPRTTLVVAFGPQRPTFRNTLQSSYLANRQTSQKDVLQQFEPLLNCLQAMGLTVLEDLEHEACDVISSLTSQGIRAGRQIMISSADYATASLICDQVTLSDTLRGTTLNEDGVLRQFGVVPVYMPDYFALVGDRSRNIPGLPGIEPATAAGLIGALGDLDSIFYQIKQISSLPLRGAADLAQRLAAHQERLLTSRQVLSLKTDLPIDLDAVRASSRDENPIELYRLYEALEFHQWAERLGQQPLVAASISPILREAPSEPAPVTATGQVGKSATSPRKAKPLARASSVTAEANTGERLALPVDIITTQRQLADWLRRLKASSTFAIGLEGDSRSFQRSRLIGIALAVSPGKAAYIPLLHEELDEGISQLQTSEVLAFLKPLMEDKAHSKISRQIKFDQGLLERHGITGAGFDFDVQLESYALDAAATPHTIAGMALRYLGVNATTFEDVAGRNTKQLPLCRVPIERASQYAGEQVCLALRLHGLFSERLAATPQLKAVYEQVERPLAPVLARIEQQGALVDIRSLSKLSDELGERMNRLAERVFKIAGEPFNLASPKQLGYILYEVLRLPALKKTATKQASTDEEALGKLAVSGHEVASLVMEYRSLSKLKNTYTDPLPAEVYPVTGRIHTTYQQSVAVTGRLTSTDPNLQNIPIRTPEGRRIREAFIAAPGYKLVAADYSQIELRIMAHMSQDAGLMAAFQQGLDVHRATAAEVFGVQLTDVTDTQRRAAKEINFGLIYGMSAFGLSEKIGCSHHEASHYISRYFERYPGVKSYMSAVREQVVRQGYVETHMGRRLYAKGIDGTTQQRKAAERAAINAPMQGTAADLMKIAMINVDNWLRRYRVDARVILQVHDELVLEVADDQVDHVCAELPSLMCSASTLSVPLAVDVGVGSNWGEAH